MTPRMIRAYDALRAAGWHDAEVARELGVSRSTIAKMLRERREKESLNFSYLTHTHPADTIPNK